MNNLKMINTLLIWSLNSSLMSSSEIIEYIDNAIETNNQIPYEYIEISLIGCNNKQSLLSALNKLDQLEYNDIVANLLLSNLAHKYINNEIEFYEALKIAGKLVETNNLYLNEKYYALFYFDDSYELAIENVYGDVETVKSDFKREIRYFEENYEEYKDLFDFEKTLSTSHNTPF